MLILSSVRPLLCTVIWSFLSVAVSGINLQITPQTVVLLSQSPPQTSFLCSGMSASNIAKIYDIVLSKMDPYGNEQVFATAEYGPLFKMDTAPNSLRKPTSATVSGGIDNSIPTSSSLKVDFETNEMLCADAGSYMCSYTYKGTGNLLHSMAAQANLSVHALPSEVTLTAQKGGMGVVGTLQMPLEMNVNESIQFTCNGKIGSEKSNWLRYKMSSMFTNTFNIYQGNVNQGSTSTASVDCSYTSSSTMTYVVQARDADRENNLAFKCFVIDQPPNQDQVTKESSVIYIIVLCNTGYWGTGCTKPCGGCYSRTCDPVDGQCSTAGCQPGYKTTTMCVDECDAGSWGSGCRETCGSCLIGTCNHVTGHCSAEGCKTTDMCTEAAAADIGPIVGGLVGALVLISVVACVVVLYKKGYRIMRPGNKSDKYSAPVYENDHGSDRHKHPNEDPQAGAESQDNSQAGTACGGTGPDPIYEKVDENLQAGAESQDERITAAYEMLERSQSENRTYDELRLADPREYENTMP